MFNKKTFTIGMMILATPALARTAAAQIEPGSLARETAKEYRERARFPESSRALKRGESDPVREKRTPTRQTMKGPDGAEPMLSVWTSKVSYERSQPIDLYASLEMKGKSFSLVAEVNSEIVDASGAILTRAAYRDDGQGPDVKAGDGVWSARVTLPEGLGSAPAESYMVRAKARLLDGDLRESAGGFLFSNPSARLTGQYRDYLKDGNLVVAAQVDVAETGRFHLAGTLYAKNGEPIGWAQAAANLEPGRHWIELSYYGLIFHDRQAAGPFRLGTLSLATTNVMPNALNDLVENAHTTGTYRLRQFRNDSFEDRNFIETAKRLELDAERARREREGAERQ